MQTPSTSCLHTEPGAVGSIVGENELPPPGPTAFAVGVTAGADELDGAAGDVELVAGASFSLVGLQAVNAPIAARAAVPEAIAMRRFQRSIVRPVCVERSVRGR